MYVHSNLAVCFFFLHKLVCEVVHNFVQTDNAFPSLEKNIMSMMLPPLDVTVVIMLVLSIAQYNVCAKLNFWNCGLMVMFGFIST